MEEELIEISINYKGIDVVAIVTLEQANILMNDEAAAADYAESILSQSQQETENVSNELQSDVEEKVTKECAESESTRKKADFMTKEETIRFLNLRAKYKDQFNDRKTVKHSLWLKIATEMKNEGYDIPDGRDGAERCRQKFANLQRGYLNYIKHMKTTGAGKRDPPSYFDEMDLILGDKDKVNPQYLEDSMESNEYSMSDSAASCSTSESNLNQKEIKNRFRSSRSSVRPTTNFNKIIELLKEQHEQSRKDKENYMKIFENAINVQNQQREKFLTILEKKGKKKRRRSSSSESEN